MVRHMRLAPRYCSIILMLCALTAQAQYLTYGESAFRHDAASRTSGGWDWLHDPSLIGLWHMDNTWADSASNNNGTATYAIFDDMPGRFGSSAGKFNGVNSSVATPNSLTNVSVFSVSFWINASASIGSANAHYPIGLGSPYAGIQLGGDQGGYGYTQYSIFLAKADNTFVQTLANTFTASADAGVWRHIVVTYDKNAAIPTHIYKDAIDLPIDPGHGQGVTGNIASAVNVTFGWRQDGAWAYPGLIDEVMLFSRVLNGAEVATLYNEVNTYAP